MSKPTASLTDDDVDRVLSNYHQHIKQHHIDNIDDTQMREKIMEMAIQHSRDADANDIEKSKLQTKLVRKRKESEIQSSSPSPKYIKNIIPYRWTKVASWIFIVLGVVFAGTFAVQKAVMINSSIPQVVASNDLSMAHETQPSDSNSHLTTKSSLSSQYQTGDNSKHDKDNDNDNDIAIANSPVLETTVDEISLEDLLESEIVMAKVEVYSSENQQENNDLQELSNKNKDVAGDFHGAEYKPSIKIRIEQAPVLPAGSMSDPKQIAIDDSI